MLPPSQLRRLNVEFDELIGSETALKNGVLSGNGFQSRVPCADVLAARDVAGAKYKNLASLIGNDRLADLIKRYIQLFYDDAGSVEGIVLHEQIDLEVNKAAGKTNNSHWHFDRMPSIKCAVLLNDTGAVNGALSIIPGSHLVTRKVALSFLEKNPDPLFIDNFVEFDSSAEVESVTLAAPAGTVILFDTMVIHKGGELLGLGERRTIRMSTWPPVLSRSYLRSISVDAAFPAFSTYHPHDRTGQRMQDRRHMFAG